MAKGPKKPIPNDPAKSNWVEAGGGLPSYIRRIAEHLFGQGHTVSQAIAIAVSQVKKWAAGGENVKPDTRAKAAAAVAAWEGVKAKSKAKSALKEAARFDYLRMTPHECQEAGEAFAARLAIVEGLLLSTAGESVPSAAVAASRDLLEGRAVRMVLRSPPARAVDVLDARVRLSREARDLRELAEALGANVEPAKPRPLPHDAEPTRTTQLQNRLASLGHALVGDGHYGPKTDAAVREFQKTQGLKDDGIVGDKTTELLRAPGAPVGSSLDADDISADPMDEPEGRDNAPASVLFKGVGVGERSGSSQVRELQAGLGDVGFNVEQDGRFGPQTDQAVKRMQRRYGLKADGIYGAKTQRTLKGVQGRNKRSERDALKREVGMGLSEAETRMDGHGSSCPACGAKKAKGKCPDCGWESDAYKAGRKIAEGRVVEHTRHGARGKLVRVKSYMKDGTGGSSFDVDAIRAGTPRHIDVNPRGRTELNVWVPGHAHSAHTVHPHTRQVRGSYGWEPERTGTWGVSDHDGMPSTDQKFDGPGAAVDWAVAKANESKGAYSEAVHDAVGGPKVGYDAPPAKRKLAEGKLSSKERKASATIERDGGKFPIPDKGHAKAALGRINQSDLSDAEKAKVRAKAKKVLSESEQAGRALAEAWSQAARDAALLARRGGGAGAGPALKGRGASREMSQAQRDAAFMARANANRPSPADAEAQHQAWLAKAGAESQRAGAEMAAGRARADAGMQRPTAQPHMAMSEKDAMHIARHGSDEDMHKIPHHHLRKMTAEWGEKTPLQKHRHARASAELSRRASVSAKGEAFNQRHGGSIG